MRQLPKYGTLQWRAAPTPGTEYLTFLNATDQKQVVTKWLVPRLLQLVRTNGELHILDIGAGTGALLKALAQRMAKRLPVTSAFRIKVIAIEQKPEFARRIRFLAQSLPTWFKIQTIQSDIGTWLQRNRQHHFDVIFLLYVVNYFDRAKAEWIIADTIKRISTQGAICVALCDRDCWRAKIRIHLAQSKSEAICDGFVTDDMVEDILRRLQCHYQHIRFVSNIFVSERKLSTLSSLQEQYLARICGFVSKINTSALSDYEWYKLLSVAVYDRSKSMISITDRAFWITPRFRNY